MRLSSVFSVLSVLSVLSVVPAFPAFPAFPALPAQTPSDAVKRFVSVDAPVVALTHVRVLDGTGAAPAGDNQTAG